MASTKLTISVATIASVLLGTCVVTRGCAISQRGTSTPSPRSPTTEVPRSDKVRPGAPSMLHVDPRHTNRSPFVGPSEPHVVWTFDTGGPVESGAVELADGTIAVASLSGKLFALTPDGALKSTTDIADRGYATPLALDERVYVGSDAHKFFAVDASGTARVALQTDADVDTAAAPTPWGALVFASGKVVYAMKPDGTLLWRVQAKRKCFSSPAVGDDGTVFVGCQDHHLYAIDPSGTVRFRIDLGADADSSPVILDDGTVVIGSDNGMVTAVDPTRGAVRWRTSVGGYVRGALSAPRNGSVLVGTYGPGARVVALTSAAGEARTVFAMGGVHGREVGIFGAPVEDAEGRLYFGAQDDFVVALETNGNVLWKLRTGGDVDAPAIITSRGRLIIGSDDGKIYAIGAP